MPENATTQGADETTDQDVFGMDFEPVTAPSSEQEGQTEPAPKKPSDETKVGEDDGAAQTTNTEAKKKRITEKKANKTQEEWQDTQERLAAQDLRLAQLELEKDQAKYEAKNPVVLSEKNMTKWEELCRQKADPEHKYHRLDFSDLKTILLGQDTDTLAQNEEAIEELEESERKPPSPPAFRSSSSRKDLPGGVDDWTYEMLKAKGYTDEQIKESGDISLTGSRR